VEREIEDLAMNRIERAVRRLDQAQQRHRATAFTFGVIKKYGDDRGGSLAALITYYGFVALFPLLLVFVTTLGIVLKDNPALRRDLLNSALAEFPVVGAQLRRNIHGLTGSGVGLALGVLVLLWGSMGVAQAAQYAMAQVWNVPGRVRPGFVPRLGRSVLILGVIGFGVVATTVIAGAATFDNHPVVLKTVTLAGTFAVNVGLYFLAFRVLTPKAITTGLLLPGAVVAALGWTGLQTLGSYLVANQLRHTSELYGFFAIVLGLLAWLFLAAQLTVYAAELNVVRARRLWPRSIVQPPLTPADRRALHDIAVAEERRPEEHVTVEFDPTTDPPEHSDEPT
jgi:YihY family inner membrane protein